MKKRVGVVILLCLVIALSVTACSLSLEDLQVYPDWAFDAMRGGDDPVLADEADTRIMSLNALVHMGGGWGGLPAKPRAHQLAAIMEWYAPDVIALQEFSKDWHKYLMPHIEDDYALLHPKRNLFLENRAPIVYNTKTLDLVESGFHVYSKKDGSNCRMVTWAVFARKDSGAKFAVTSTHWDYGQEDKKVGYRETQMRELNEIIVEIVKNHGCPVFAAGDYNVSNGAEKDTPASYWTFLELSGMLDVKFADGVFIRPELLEQTAIDHIFLNGNATLCGFNKLDGSGNEVVRGFYDSLSDHYPIYADVKLAA